MVYVKRAVHNTKQEYKVDKTLAEQFEKYMKKYYTLYQSLVHIVLENIPSSLKKPTIVDLGMGPGLLSLELHKAVFNA